MAATLAWSPDGTELLVQGTADGRLGIHRIARLGGPPRLVSPYGQFGIWSPDGGRIAHWSYSGPVVVTDLVEGKTSKAAERSDFDWFIYGAWSPDGERIVFTTIRTGISEALYLLEVKTGRMTRLLEEAEIRGVVWTPSGDGVYYLAGGKLRKVKVGGEGSADEPATLATPGRGAAEIRLTADGRSLSYVQQARRVNFWLIDRLDAPDPLRRQVSDGANDRSGPSLSPDGQSIAFVQEGPQGRDLYRMPLAGGSPVRLTFDGLAQIHSTPAWSPDGNRVAFIVAVEGINRVAIADAERPGPPRSFAETEPGAGLRWAPSRRILYQRRGNRNYHFLDPGSKAESPLLTNDSLGWVLKAIPAPAGEWVVVNWSRGDGNGIWLLSAGDTSQRLIRRGDAVPLGWSSDGRFIYLLEPKGRIVRLSSSGESGPPVGAIPLSDIDECDLRDQRTGRSSSVPRSMGRRTRGCWRSLIQGSSRQGEAPHEDAEVRLFY